MVDGNEVLISSMTLFIASTIVIIFSPTMQWFNICRLFQGIGGTGGIVLSRSIATDYYSGRELAKILAIIGAINGIAPVVSPVAGGLSIKLMISDKISNLCSI